MEGLERSRRANWKHGHFSREAKAERSRLRAAILVLRDLRDSIYKAPAIPRSDIRAATAAIGVCGTTSGGRCAAQLRVSRCRSGAQSAAKADR
jgi:hypothetical protein